MARFVARIRKITEGGKFENIIIARDIVPTLYELLGALPDDDADTLRAAFRKAAKASHPDNNPADPDAPQKFRQIVRAHSILRDEMQRATYDQLLSEAEQQRTLEPRRRAFSELGIPGPIGSMVIASVSIGAFVALERAFAIPVAPAQVQELATRAVALIATAPAPAPGTVGKAGDKPSDKAGERDKPDTTSPARAPEISNTVEEIAAPVAVATVANDAAITATSEPMISAPVVKDANYYLERGNLAYRTGDFPLALTDFDLAIHLDPNSSDAYVNRAIVFRRMGDLKRALADVVEAKRIDEGRPQ